MPCRSSGVERRASYLAADRDDRNGLPDDDRGVAAACITGAVSGYRADVFTLGDTGQQITQDRAVAIAAGGKLHRPDVRSSRIHSQMNLAPLVAALNAMLSRLLLAVAEELDPGAVHLQAQEAHRHDDTGFGWQASFAVGTASSSQARPNPDAPL